MSDWDMAYTRRLKAVGRSVQVLFVVALVTASILPTQLSAQSPPAATSNGKVITKERLEAAQNLMIAMGAERRFGRIVDIVATRLAGAMKRQHSAHSEQIEAAYKAVAIRFADRSRDAVALIAPLYAEKFTASELSQALAFYRSPVGRKIVSSEAEIARRSLSLGAVWGGRIGRQMQRAALAELAGRGIDLTMRPKSKN